MKLTIDETDGITTICLEGRLDLEETMQIDQRLALATSTRALLIAFDLSRLSYIASIGIRSLIMATRVQATRGGKVAIFGPEPNVKKVLTTTGIDRLIPLCDDFAAAAAVLRAPGSAAPA